MVDFGSTLSLAPLIKNFYVRSYFFQYLYAFKSNIFVYKCEYSKFNDSIGEILQNAEDMRPSEINSIHATFPLGKGECWCSFDEECLFCGAYPHIYQGIPQVFHCLWSIGLFIPMRKC